MPNETYTETVYRFIVEYHEELPAEHQAQMRLNGIDPDNYWNLKWSFQEEKDAQNQLEKEIEQYAEICAKFGFDGKKTFRVRDLGETQYITRSVMF